MAKKPLSTFAKKRVASFLSKLALSETDAAPFLRRSTDLPEVELGDCLRTQQRLLVDSKRPSVIAGNHCVAPDLWHFGNTPTFGCPRCSEQDVCPFFKAEFSKERLSVPVHHRPERNDKYRLAAQYWGIPLRFISIPEDEVEKVKKALAAKDQTPKKVRGKKEASSPKSSITEALRRKLRKKG